MRMIVIVLFFLSSWAFAETESYGGTGCPSGSAALSFDQQGNLEINFEEYRLQARSGGAQRSSCNIAWPVSAPAGYALDLGTAKANGYLLSRENTTARFNAENFASGSRGPLFGHVVTRPHDGILNFQLPAHHRTSCGQDAIIRLNTSIELESRGQGEDSFLEIQKIVIEKPRLIRCN